MPNASNLENINTGERLEQVAAEILDIIRTPVCSWPIEDALFILGAQLLYLKTANLMDGELPDEAADMRR